MEAFLSLGRQRITLGSCNPFSAPKGETFCETNVFQCLVLA